MSFFKINVQFELYCILKLEFNIHTNQKIGSVVMKKATRKTSLLVQLIKKSVVLNSLAQFTLVLFRPSAQYILIKNNTIHLMVRTHQFS